MAAPSKSIARILVPLAVLFGLGMLIALPAIRGNQPSSPTPAQQGQASPTQPETQPVQPPETQPETAADTPADPTPSTTGQATDQDQAPSASPPRADPALPAAPLAVGDFRILPVLDPDGWQYDRIGGVDPERFELELTFSLRGAGLERVELANYQQHLGSADPVPVQQEWPLQTAGGTIRIVPFAAVAVEINGQRVSVYTATDEAGVAQPAWRQLEPGRFEAVIADAAGTPVVRLERHYRADGTRLDYTLTQKAENLTGRPMSLRWITFGPAQLYRESFGYAAEVRRVRFGKVEPGSPHFVVGGDHMRNIGAIAGPRDKVTGLLQPTMDLWPTAKTIQNNHKLAWTGLTNRYFGAAVHALANGQPTPGVAPLLTDVERVSRVVLDTSARTDGDNYIVGLQLTSPAYDLPASQTIGHDLGIYTGPLDRSLISANPSAQAVMLRQLVQYTFGGPCGFCTFPWLAHFLVWLLNIIHDYLAFDWALAIIVLVLIVRSILHPVTKWSQIRVQRFSHQMQQMAPKQKKIQEKYKGDSKRIQAEMAKLWREEGINPAGMLGCLPMFLQTPVWIALYASLFFAIELRHQAAFFGIFQQIGGWPFLGDLARPDSAIPLPQAMHFIIPFMGKIDSINLLPLLLGVVFFVQQKYMMPPPTATMTPEQLAQQKMMKVMMVVLFPLIMYNAPSGLAVYFIANSALGIVEMRYIRAHITKNDLLTPKQRDPGKKTFFQRLMEQAQQRQEMIQAAKGRAPAKGPTSGALGARRKKTENRRKGQRP